CLMDPRFGGAGAPVQEVDLLIERLRVTERPAGPSQSRAASRSIELCEPLLKVLVYRPFDWFCAFVLNRTLPTGAVSAARLLRPIAPTISKSSRRRPLSAL